MDRVSACRRVFRLDRCLIGASFEEAGFLLGHSGPWFRDDGAGLMSKSQSKVFPEGPWSRLQV